MAKKDQISQEESLSDEDKANHMKTLIEGICFYIRFPMMTVSELASIPLKPITNYHKEFFCERMAIGMSFHANQPIAQEMDELQYTPRLYTADNFCLQMEIQQIHTVENYKNFPACFFSLAEFPYNSNDGSDGELMTQKIYDVLLNIAILENQIQWEVDFYPRGIMFDRAQIINVYRSQLPNQESSYLESQSLKTVRVRCTYRGSSDDEQRFKVCRIWRI